MTTTRIPSQLPARRVSGSPGRWAVDHAMLGGLLPLTPLVPILATMSFWFGPMSVFGVLLETWTGFAALSLLSAVGTAGIAALAPPVLDGVRGKVPLPLLALLAGALSATIGFTAGVVSDFALGTQLGLFVPLAAAASGAGMLLIWLPYTMAVVLRARTWPVVLGGLATTIPIAGAVYGLMMLAMV